jgi:pimeloyl-ACP methyl ester carboxylesterase
LKIQEVLLCGHSLGGAIAQSYYFKYPKDVAGLILCATGGKLRVNPFILESLKNNYKVYLDSIPAGAFYRKTPKEIINKYIAETSQVKVDVTLSDFSICDSFDTLNKTRTINIPTLIIVGREDKWTPVKYSQFFQDNIKGSEFVIIENSGHMVMIEQPEETNRAILNFIKNYFN